MPPPARAAAPAEVGPGARPGLLRAIADPRLRPLLTLVLLASTAQGLFLVLFVFFVTGSIHGSEADVGLLRGVQAVGAIGAGVVLGAFGSRLGVVRLLLIGLAAFTVIDAVVWNLPFLTASLLPYGVLFAAIGAPGVLFGTGLTSLLQRAADPARRGAAFAAVGLAQGIGQAVGLLVGGLRDAVGTLPLLEVQVAVYAVATIAAVVVLRPGRGLRVSPRGG